MYACFSYVPLPSYSASLHSSTSSLGHSLQNKTTDFEQRATGDAKGLAAFERKIKSVNQAGFTSLQI